MRFKFIPLLIVLVLFSVASIRLYAQIPENTIEWNEYYSLQWTDFRGKPGVEAAGDAGTAVEIKAKPYRIRKTIEYDVHVLFNRDKSWYRDTSKALLEHERLHFDLAELYGRKIRKKISELKRNNVNDVNTYNQAIRKLLEESNEEDTRYDLETLHGAITKKQIVWEQSIKRELQGLDTYKKQRKVISRAR